MLHSAVCDFRRLWLSRDFKSNHFPLSLVVAFSSTAPEVFFRAEWSFYLKFSSPTVPSVPILSKTSSPNRICEDHNFLSFTLKMERISLTEWRPPFKGRSKCKTSGSSLIRLDAKEHLRLKAEELPCRGLHFTLKDTQVISIPLVLSCRN